MIILRCLEDDESSAVATEGNGRSSGGNKKVTKGVPRGATDFFLAAKNAVWILTLAALNSFSISKNHTNSKSMQYVKTRILNRENSKKSVASKGKIKATILDENCQK